MKEFCRKLVGLLFVPPSQKTLGGASNKPEFATEELKCHIFSR